MILPYRGAAFTQFAEGDQRADATARASVSRRLGIPPDWATVRQVHNGDVITVSSPGSAGAADALLTSAVGLPLAVFTADCLGVILHAEGAVGVAHAGWRGVVAGIVANLSHEMQRLGNPPTRGVAGPGIGPCCFEVGEEVGELLGKYASLTTWGTRSVDLYQAVQDQVPVSLTSVGGCTRCGGESYSHRLDGTTARMAAIGWLE